MLESLIAPVVSGLGSFFGGQSANATAVAMSRENREWQEKMSSTAHQRQILDMQRAGLNPILSAGGGGGASTPSGSVPTVAETATPAINSAISAARNSNESKLNEEHVKNIASDTKNKNEQTALIQSQKNQVDADTFLKMASARAVPSQISRNLAESTRARSSAGSIDQDIITKKYENIGKHIESQIDQTNYGKGLRYVNRSLPLVNAAVGGISRALLPSFLSNAARVHSLSKKHHFVNKRTGEVIND